MTDAARPELIYKVASPEVTTAADAAGRFAGMPVDLADGYLHFSTAAQLRETLRRYFAGTTAVLLALPIATMGPALRWEPARGGQLFPHLYGTFPMSDVVHRATIEIAADGGAALPDWVR